MPPISRHWSQADIKLGLNETLGLTGSLRAAVRDIEAKLKEIDDPRLINLVVDDAPAREGLHAAA